MQSDDCSSSCLSQTNISGETLYPDDENECDSDEFYGLDILDGPTDDMNNGEHDSLETKPSLIKPENWKDKLVSDVGERCILFLHSSKSSVWIAAKEEMQHVCYVLCKMR